MPMNLNFIETAISNFKCDSCNIHIEESIYDFGGKSINISGYLSYLINPTSARSIVLTKVHQNFRFRHR